MTRSVPKRQDPLIGKLDLIDDDQTEPLLNDLASIKAPITVAFMNQHAYNLAQQNPVVHRHFSQMSYLLRDGIGIKLACQVNGRAPRANMNGSDFIPKLVDHLVEQDNGQYQYLVLGTREPWLSKGARRLFHGKPFKALDGFQPVQAYIDFVRQHCADGRIPVVVLAMGMPKQEEVALQIKRELDCPALLICGGAIIDFSAERFARAPLIFRKMGLEWLYRLGKEPRRLFKRYVIGIPQFFYYVARNSRAVDSRQNTHRVLDQ